MDLSFQAPGEHLFVRSVSAQGICIADQCYSQSLLLAADQLISDWAPQALEELKPEHLDAVFLLQPDLVLLGTGSRQHFPSTDLMMMFYQRGVGIEVMGTAPACRTFNVLVAESRRVVAALMPMQPPGIP
jgi:uncharacterized protein